MRAAGAWVFSGGLHAPSTRDRPATRAVTRSPMTDGPYAEGKEHIGGLVIIKADEPRRRARLGSQGRAGDDAADRGAAVPGRARGLTRACRRVTRAEIERVFREQYGRAVAVLARVFGDIDIAEEAVQDAFATAVARWPEQRPAARAGGMDHHDGAQPRDRPPAARGLAR